MTALLGWYSTTVPENYVASAIYTPSPDYAVLYQHVKVPISYTDYGHLKLAHTRRNRRDKGKTVQRKCSSPRLPTSPHHQPDCWNSEDCSHLQTGATESCWTDALGAEKLRVDDKKGP